MNNFGEIVLRCDCREKEDSCFVTISRCETLMTFLDDSDLSVELLSL